MRVTAAIVAALLLTMVPVHAAGKTADARLRAIYTAEWKWREAQFADDQDGTKPVVDRLPKVAAAAQAARLAYWQRVMKRLDAIPYAKLSPKERVNYDVYKPQIANLIADQKFRAYEMPANSDSSFWTDIGYTARRPFRTLADYRSWIAQMRDIPRYFREQIEEMRAGEKRGFTPPRQTLEGRDASIAAVTQAKPEESLLYTPFKEMLSNVPPAEQASLRAEAMKVIREEVQPAYAELLKFWDGEYVPGARTTLAAEALPDGKAYYRQQIREYTTLDLSPDAIHKIGVDEVAKLHAEMIAAMQESGFKGDFSAFLAFLRSDPQFTAKTPQDLLDRAAWIAKEFDGKASQYFGLLPRTRFAIKPVPDDMAPFYTAGRGGPGVYLLNTYDLPHRPLYSLTALTLHESAPGHAFQIPLAMEDKTLPDFRRYTYISAYGEGWAVYCEWLGQEMGMYKTPYERFGMLGYQIWRAARLVVDTGIHSQGWTRAQAIQYLRDYTALPDREIETEVDRYITWPGQALSYYLGEMAIREARAKAEKALGPKFDLRAFHDTVLQLGSVPLPVLTKRIDAFIAGGGKGPYPDLE
ncbi:MAG: DUF885 family protein [Alphaproteobacteria bacterium]|nr:DUF885 family protein [Alphaproteobacteria bacterium]MDE2629917.1 DUF885 family protein [Alphaproteobacteria bacterium]